MADTVIAGRYRLIEPLGRGAMSAVWLADDDELGRPVAVKMLAATADRARFEREARAAASLSHPNISSLYDYGESDGRPYMVLEYLPGGTLEDRLAGGSPLPEGELRRIARQIAEGLAHAHSRGLVHRDLKPANILFDGEGRAKIADFGIARMGSAGTLTEAGTVLGTASYISPEQASGLPAGPASDVYSFGVMCFRMLTGRLPFVATNAMELVRMHRDDPPPAIESVRPDVPPDLAAIVTAALAKDPAARPPDGAALVLALEDGFVPRAGPGDTTEIRPGAAAAEHATRVLRPPAPPPGRRRRLAPAAVATVAAVLLAGGAAAAWLATRPGSDPNDTPPAVSLTLPKVPTSSPAALTTAAPTTAAATTTAAVSTGEPTTTAKPTTRAATTAAAPASTAPAVSTPPVIATTTAPPPTVPPTTAATTTAVLPTTTPATTADTTTTATTTSVP